MFLWTLMLFLIEFVVFQFSYLLKYLQFHIFVFGFLDHSMFLIDIFFLLLQNLTIILVFI